MNRQWKAAAICVVVLLALDGGALVLIARSSRLPAFERGGTFVRTGTAPPTTVSPPTSPPESTSTVPATTGPTRGVATTTSAPPSAASGGSEGAGSGPVTPARPGPPDLGTYTFAVRGTEGANIVGSRQFPPQMTLVAHRRGGVGADQVVLDQEFSAEHEEREIARYGDDGIELTDEAGSLSFGLVTQASDVSYDPPMGQIPFPLVVGSSRSGTSTAREPSGTVARVDEWSTRIVGQETVTVAGEPTATWVVAFERRSRPGTNEQVTQKTRYWFDPVRRTSVKWEETLHGERDTPLIRGVYDAQYVATLQSFRAG